MKHFMIWSGVFLNIVLLAAQTPPPTPIVQPHVTFVNASGGACAGCKLYTYVAGTTTPQPTYTDATGGSQNTNPIVLDAAGGAQIWLGSLSYKFILKDVSGATIWSVDQVNASRLYPCPHAYAVQIANGTLNGFTCDATITIDNVNHLLNVGGALPSTHFTMRNLGAITVPWTFDVTSPTTAALSLGGGTRATGKYIDGGSGLWTVVPPGTVTSIGITVPSQMTVTGTPVTTSGVIALGLHTTGTETDLVTAPGAGTDGNCATWNSTGGLGDAPCGLGAFANGTTGYQVFGSGRVEQWTRGATLGSGDNETPQTTNLPYPCPTSVDSVLLTPLAGGTDYGEMISLMFLSATTGATPSVTYYYERNADHSGMTVTPQIYVVCH